MKAEISSLVEVIEKDFKSRFPKYPDQTKFILKDKNAVNAILSRFEKGQLLLSIKALPYNFATGLNFICFEFSPQSKNTIGHDSFLVIINGDCKVISIIEPFDLKQPNNWVPPLPDQEDTESAGTTPFALARPSGLDNIKINSEDLYPMEVRSREFFARLGGRVGIFGRGGFNLDDGSGGVQTTCTYVTGTLWEGPFPGMGNRVFPRAIYDSSLDDCEPA